MKPKSMGVCMWPWNRVNPGLSATKSIAAVLRCAMLNVKNSGIAGKGLTAEGLTISVARKPGTRLISAAGEGYKGVQTQANLKADLAVWKLAKLGPAEMRSTK